MVDVCVCVCVCVWTCVALRECWMRVDVFVPYPDGDVRVAVVEAVEVRPVLLPGAVDSIHARNLHST